MQRAKNSTWDVVSATDILAIIILKYSGRVISSGRLISLPAFTGEGSDPEDLLQVPDTLLGVLHVILFKVKPQSLTR